MKHFSLKPISVVAILAMTAYSLPLSAADAKNVPWNSVCREAQGRELLVTSDDGSVVSGSCFSIDANDIAVNTPDRGVVKIARKTLSKLEVQASRKHQVRKLGKEMHHSLKFGFKQLFSPAAPVGMVVVPAVIAWGAVAFPFCVLGDLGDEGTAKQELRPI